MVFHEILDGHTIPFSIRRHSQAKRTSLTLYPDSQLVVTLPPRATHAAAFRLIRSKRDWIVKHITQLKKSDSVRLPSLDIQRISEYRARAHEIVSDRLSFFNQIYSLSFHSFHVTNTLRQWGSCSTQKKLRYNIRIIFLPVFLQDLIIVHELCHIKEMNHSRNFWELVSQSIPDYAIREHELKKFIILS